MVDTIEFYLSNWLLVLNVYEKIGYNIVKKVIDFHLKRNIEQYIHILKTIAFSCDKVQRENCTICKTVEI